MKQYIGCDAHRRYSVFVSVDEQGKASPPSRVEHDREEFRKFLKTLPEQSPVAVEASGGWYWLMSEIEQAGLEPHLVHATEAKRRMRGRNKTDALDAKGLAYLLYDKRLPEVWIPADLLDVRGLMRARLAIRSYQTSLKNRIMAAINRYGLRGNDGSGKDWFCGAGRVQLNTWLMGLPEYTRISTIEEWRLVDEMETAIDKLEKQIAAKIGKIGYVRLLDTLPGVGKILAPTLYLEIGNVNRFPTAEHLASYAGLVPKVLSSGGKTFHGRVSKESNHYLKWAFVEAANCIVMHTWKYEQSHVGKLYARLKAAKGHGKAAVAVARHLAEASWWILRTAQAYREPAPATTSSSKNG